MGVPHWSKKYSTSFNEWCYSVRKAGQYNFVMCGMSDSLEMNFERAIVRLVDGNGNMISEKYFRGGGGAIQNTFYSVETTSDKGFILCGFTDIGSGRGYIVKTDSLLNIKPLGISNITFDLYNYYLIQNYPNPFNGNTIISFKINKSEFIQLKFYDLKGSEICTLVNEKLNSGIYKFEFNPNIYFLTSGIYFYNLIIGISKSNIFTKKLLYIK
ncbi:MAG: T9SS type A sorting domain-containing protein [Ignavibacteria bacterium]|nr:T9SS type A sorting domain-containing protein [Ignavibacteria bacterium]